MKSPLAALVVAALTAGAAVEAERGPELDAESAVDLRPETVATS